MSSGSSQAPNASSPDWDPFKQSFTLLLPNGEPFPVPIPALDTFAYYNTRISAAFGSQLGGSLLLLVVLAIVTGREKRRSPIFVTNMVSLVLNTLRCFLQILYFSGPWSEVYAVFAGDYSRVPASSYANSIAAEVVALLLLVAVEVSLVMQAHVVCATARDVYRYIISFASAVIALTAIGLRFALVVVDVKSTLTASSPPWHWLASGSNIMTTISICFFCAVFVMKLGFAVLQRRKLGLKQFGPMQVVFIMGCQTLIVPGA
jgi:pheromone alpha factor receptor